MADKSGEQWAKNTGFEMCSSPVSHRPGRAAAVVPDVSLVRVPTPPDGVMRSWVTTTTDHSGRVAARTPLRLLGLVAGTPVRVRVHEDLLISVVLDGSPRGSIVAPGGASNAITAQGYLRLPLAVRRRCRIEAGARILVTVWGDPGGLVLYTAPVASALLGTRARSVIESETSGGRGQD